jgi:hypothetical protein
MSGPSRIVVAPPVPALLPAHSSLADPVAELRDACLAAMAWLGPEAEVVADDDQARRVGEWLLGPGRPPRPPVGGAGPGLLVMANGSACRSERAPGHLDERAAAFDEELGAALAAGDTAALARLDLALGDELLASGLRGLAGLSGMRVAEATVDHADDPFGVMYWVVRWQCES